MQSNKQRGFTLVELLVVIGIIAVLTSIAVVALGSARRKARDAKRVADVKAIQNSLELYYQESNGYPLENDPIELGVGDIVSLCASGFQPSCGSTESEFMKLIPSAPTPIDGDCDEDENRYLYSASITGSYEITFCIGDDFGDFQGGPLIASEDGIFQN